MAYRTYTSCVQPQDYRGAPSNLAYGLSILGSALLNPLALGPMAWYAIESALDYMLNGKLVCLGGDRCAIGQYISHETPDDKSFPESVDNDYSLNILLYPDIINSFHGTTRDFAFNYQNASTNIQGELITEQPNMPVPREPRTDQIYALGWAGTSERYDPYRVEIAHKTAKAMGGSDWNPYYPETHPLVVPVLHCECEGSRIRDLLDMVRGFGSLGLDALGVDVCGFKPLGIAVGKVLCAIVATLLSPFLIVGLIVAWNNAHDGDKGDPLVAGEEGGSLGTGDFVIITGRWSYDSGHSGWNELHPVKRIQKIRDPFLPDPKTAQPINPREFVSRWCALVMEVPPPDRNGPGQRPTNLTAEQQQLWDNQRQPQHRWILHPQIDSCLDLQILGTHGPGVEQAVEERRSGIFL
ncbi:MAG: hypothetical protein M3R24_39670 [Chloroflexota bacterium]|nr:hypothetical protein [Chloroflexota bacterium]